MLLGEGNRYCDVNFVRYESTVETRSIELSHEKSGLE